MPFTVAQVRAIFEKLSDADVRIQRIVRLAFYTGCRLSEIVGLRLAIFERRKACATSRSNLTPGRGLKNRSSIRRVPLHPAIQDFAAVMLPFKPATGHYWSKRSMVGSRKTVGISDPRLTLHSARHSFKDRCRAAGLTEEVHDALTGHSNGSVSRSYGRGVPLKVLAEAVVKIGY